LTAAIAEKIARNLGIRESTLMELFATRSKEKKAFRGERK
jgi:hypothetical protein